MSAISCERKGVFTLTKCISHHYCTFRSVVWQPRLLYSGQLWRDVERGLCFIFFFVSERGLARRRASEKPPPTWQRSSGTPTWITGKAAKNCMLEERVVFRDESRARLLLNSYHLFKREMHSSIRREGGRCCRVNHPIQRRKELACLRFPSVKCFFYSVHQIIIYFFLHRTRVYDLIQLAQNQIPC